MAARSFERGHEMKCIGGVWYYTDTGGPVAWNRRDCKKCGRPDTPEGHDPCLGKLPGVMNACCGHGYDSVAYVQLVNGSHISGLGVKEFLISAGKARR
jgi:hypothetical protein